MEGTLGHTYKVLSGHELFGRACHRPKRVNIRLAFLV